MNSIDGQDFALNECGALSRVGKNVSGYETASTYVYLWIKCVELISL